MVAEGALHATPTTRLRETAMGGTLQISQAGTPIWQATQSSILGRTAGHRLKDVVVDQATYAIAYDDRGRITTAPDLDLTFDGHNRLSTASNGTVTEAYLYDGLGQMVARQDTTGEFEQFLWHDNQMVGAYTATGATRWEAVWGTGQDVLLGFFDHMAGRNVIPVRDWRNNVVSAYQPGAACTGCTPGASLGRAEYTAEGRVTTYAPDNTITCFEEGSGQVCPMPGNLPFAFNGQWRSPLTGLSYIRNRWYSPRLGQFISHDPLHYIDSTNMYAFAAFDPINSWDPLELESGGNLAETPKIEEKPAKTKPTSGEEKKEKSKKSKKNNNESDDECGRFDPCSSKFVTEGAGNQQDGSIYNGDQYGFDGIRLMADLMVDSLIMMVAPEEQLFRFAAPLGQAISAKASRVMAGRAGQALAKVCSFTEDTPVLMCDGSLRAIQEVEEGEWVLAQNEHPGDVGRHRRPHRSHRNHRQPPVLRRGA